MKLLVIVPMYNAEKFIQTCVTSILSQGVNVLLYVVDDASTDKSASIIAKNKGIVLLRNESNQGTYYSINSALKKASEDSTWTHYCIHGADDVSLPSRFKKQMSHFTNQILAVGCGFSRVDYSTKKIISSTTTTNESMLIFSRKVFEKLGYYDVFRVGSDTEYKRRLLAYSPNCIYSIKDVLYHAYVHSNNLTKKVPLGGTVRKNYVNTFTRRHIVMKKEKKFYLPFKP